MIFVDDAFIPSRGYRWCHLVSDQNEQELHDFAQKIGLKKSYFQPRSYPHYDVTTTVRERALQQGATACSYMEVLEHNYAYLQKKNGG